MTLLDIIPQARGALMTGAAILSFGTGVAAAEAWERVLPWGLGPRLERLRDSLPARDAEQYGRGAIEQRRLDQTVIEQQWAPALAKCSAGLAAASRAAAGSLDAERKAAERSSTAAFRLGRAACVGASNAEKPTDLGTDAVSMRGTDENLRSLVAASLGTTP